MKGNKKNENSIKISYYNLKESKQFNDGSIVDTEVLLRKIPPIEEEWFTVETTEGYGDEKKIFWTKENEVVFVEIKEEIWTDKMLKQQKLEREENWFIKDINNAVS